MAEDRAKQLALLLTAMDELEQERADYNANWKARMETLRSEIGKIRMEILTGQMVLGEKAEGAGA